MGDKITLRWQGLLVGGTPPKDPDAQGALPSFIGSIQRFILNNINYFELAKISTRGCEYKYLLKRNVIKCAHRGNSFLNFIYSFGRLAQSAHDLQVPETRETSVARAHDHVLVEEHVHRIADTEGLLENGGVFPVQDQTHVRTVILQRRQTQRLRAR